jgi:hypothetical protein
MNNELRQKLHQPFPAAKVKQKRGQGGRTMSYISHGLVTERLNDADPDWSVERIATHTYVDGSGALHCAGVELALTVGGVTRVEAGGPQRQDGFTNEIKNAYSDALKRAAMRFGVALGMWETLVDAEGDEDYAPDTPGLGPVDFASTRGRRLDSAVEDTSRRMTSVDQVATGRQLKFIQAITRESGRSDDDVADLAQQYYGKAIADLTRREASAFIEALQRPPDPADEESVPPNRTDAPECDKTVPPRNVTPPSNTRQPERAGGPSMTPRQRSFLIGLAKELGMTVIGPDGGEHHDEAAMNALIRERIHPEATFDKLGSGSASILIEEWMTERDNRKRKTAMDDAEQERIGRLVDAELAAKAGGVAGADKWTS